MALTALKLNFERLLMDMTQPTSTGSKMHLKRFNADHSKEACGLARTIDRLTESYHKMQMAQVKEAEKLTDVDKRELIVGYINSLPHADRKELLAQLVDPAPPPPLLLPGDDDA